MRPHTAGAVLPIQQVQCLAYRRYSAFYKASTAASPYSRYNASPYSRYSSPHTTDSMPSMQQVQCVPIQQEQQPPSHTEGAVPPIQAGLVVSPHSRYSSLKHSRFSSLPRQQVYQPPRTAGTAGVAPVQGQKDTFWGIYFHILPHQRGKCCYACVGGEHKHCYL